MPEQPSRSRQDSQQPTPRKIADPDECLGAASLCLPPRVPCSPMSRSGFVKQALVVHLTALILCLSLTFTTSCTPAIDNYIKNGDVEAVREYIATGKADLNRYLLGASAACQPAIVSLLLDRGADARYRRAENGWTALHATAMACIILQVPNRLLPILQK